MIIQGIQPTGKSHLGNYFGAIKNQIELIKNKKFCITLIAVVKASVLMSNCSIAVNFFITGISI